MKKILVLDTETIDTIENKNNGEDICTQLSFIDVNNKAIYDNYCKPALYKEMTVSAMEFTEITPEFLEDKPKVEETESYKMLKTILSNSNDEIYVVGHNIDFDLEVIKRTGIDISNVKKICTLKLARYINDSLGLPLESCRLKHLKYAFKLYLKRNEQNLEDFTINKTSVNSLSSMSHNAVNDILDCLELLRYIQTSYHITLEEAHKLTVEPLELIFIPSGKLKGQRIQDLDYNSLVWHRDNFYCTDTKYACIKELERRNNA